MTRTTGDPHTDGPERGSGWADAVDGLTRALQLGADLQRRMTRGTVSNLDLGPAAMRDAQEEWRRYATHVTELTVDYYRAVADAARDYGERLAADRDTDRRADRHDGSMHASHDDGHRTSGAARGDLDGPVIELRGPTGSVLAASFSVENRDPDPAAVTVTPGLAVAPDGTRLVVPLSVDPPSLTIPAGGVAAVSLRLPLAADVFEPDVTYRVPLRVDGPRPTTIDVVVVAEERPPGGDPERDGYRVRCPACRRTFERTTADLRLRPHNTPDGDACPERAGRRVRRH